MTATRTATTPPENACNACKFCLKPMDRARPWQDFCNDGCRYSFHNARRRAGPEKESPPTAATVAGGVGQKNIQPANPATRQEHRQLRANTKIFSVLAELARGARMTRFDAERVCHDHVLNSTIPEIEKRGILVSRKEIIVPGHRGKPTRCSLYWLAAPEIAKAAVLLGWRAQEKKHALNLGGTQ